MTFKEWTEEWIEVYIKPHRRPNTVKCYQDTLKHLCRNFPGFVETEMDKVTGVQVQKVVNQIGERHSKSLCRIAKVMMNQSFRTAIQSDLCEHNPAQYLQIPSYASEKKVLPLSAQEEMMIRQAAPHIRYGWWAVFLLETGMRVGEFAALQWKDVDLKNRVLYVRKSKTESGVRLVPLTKLAAWIIAKQPVNEECPYIFKTDRGAQASETSIKKLCRRLERETGIPDIHCHRFRHTFATNFLEAGAEDKTVAQIMGHTDVNFTKNRYVHLKTEILIQQIELLEQKSTADTSSAEKNGFVKYIG